MLRNIKVLSPQKFSGLSKRLSADSRIVPVDATWYLPNQNKIGFNTFKKSRIPNSIFVDIDEVKDDKSPYPHMLPTIDIFERKMSDLGIKNNDHLVVYDQVGNFSAPRAAWMFNVFKHNNVYLLDNFQRYIREKYEIDDSPLSVGSTLTKSTYKVPNDVDLNEVVSFEEIYDIISDSKKASQYYILDARPGGRFSGVDPEPRPGLPSGHAPNVISCPANDVLNSEIKTFKSKDQLNEIFSTKGIDNSKPIIVMCGTGVTACIVKSALEISGLGAENGLKVYDGSWTEFAQRADSKYIISDK